MEIIEQEFKPQKNAAKKIKKEPTDNVKDKDYSPSKPQKIKKKTCKKQEHKLWTCRKCLQEFDSRKLLTEHSKNHSSDSSDEHSFKHDPEHDLYRCNTCSLEFSTQKDVENHIQKIHEEFYACDVCSHTSKKAYTFAVHMKTHSKDDTMVCPLCTYTTQRRTCLQTHINRVHYHKFYYTCEVCNKGFNDSVIYKEHNNEHLVRHHTVYIEGTLHKTQCSICLKVFSKVDTLLKHITSKHKQGEERNEKRHLCDFCGKGFGSSDKLKIHYRIHTGEKPYHCKFCEKCFTKKDYLIMHERVHTGEKPYPCEHCGKCFNQACSLRIHVRGHTGERPYICQFCNGGYISRGSLNLHMKSCNNKKVQAKSTSNTKVNITQAESASNNKTQTSDAQHAETRTTQSRKC
ncbi:unnamed protein product [Ceutorhynchus assimilis]|uniref:C2H2-type domain-containing protein n=1 Tax=Ceutorhynchus assimilis TaxID=467358 RepID=A0A9N9QB48_9CUCU|nr:unnamed protein product [Ceutorhynchus assimilis]